MVHIFQCLFNTFKFFIKETCGAWVRQIFKESMSIFFLKVS